MYPDWTNQAEHLVRYFAAFGLLMILFPKLVFRRVEGGLTERIAIRFMLMTVFLILLGYTLVILRLFEVLAIMPAILIAVFRRPLIDLLRYRKSGNRRRENSPEWVIRLLDWLEGKFDMRAAIRNKLLDKLRQWRGEVAVRLKNVRNLSETLLLLAVLAISAWIRFYDAVVSAAPAMSDGYVTLAWMKYIDQRILFHDGIYPQGFHIWMTYLFKFAAVDPLYVLKYTGPLDSVMFMLGLYLAVSRWSGNRLGGIAAAAVYGFLGDWVVGSAIERQTATNSQEFAFVFVFPTLLFLYCWLRDRDRFALAGAVAGMMLVGLVHTLAYVYLGIGVFLMLLIYVFFTVKERFRSLRPVILGGILSVVASVVPLGIGLLLGRSLHSSSANFAVSQNDGVYVPYLWPIDYVGLAAVGFILLWLLPQIRRLRAHTGPLFVAMFSLLTFVIYYFGGRFSFPGSTVITARSSDLWGFALTVAIGTAIGLLFRSLDVRRWTGSVHLLVAAAGVAGLLLYAPPEPIRPYKMEWDSSIEQYLTISESFRPKTWHLVSPSREGYSIVLGSGYHIDTTEFLDTYDPDTWPLAKYGEASPDTNLSSDIFIYYPNQIFKVSEQNAIYTLLEADYEQREMDKSRLDEWLERHRRVNPDIRIWYRDEVLTVYHLHRPKDRQSIYEQIWGGGTGDS